MSSAAKCERFGVSISPGSTRNAAYGSVPIEIACAAEVVAKWSANLAMASTRKRAPASPIIAQTNIADGRVTSCQRVDVINKYGNIGKIVGDYHEAELKVLVFGDSWSAFHHDGRTWPLFPQEVLEARLNKKVYVVDFGRGAYGILQMFDLAAAKIAEWKPDVAVFAFITDDLDRARFWRTVVARTR